MLNRISGGLRVFLALPVGYGGALLVTVPLTLLFGTDPVSGAVIGTLFGGWIGFVGSYFAPSPRWKPALFFVGLTLFIVWALIRGNAGDYWEARSRAALIASIIGGVVSVILDRRERARAALITESRPALG